MDASATGTGDGRSWANAYPELRFAAAVGAGEIWVAEGTYTPDPSDRTASFRVFDGVRLYGGFPAGGAPFDARDPDLYSTILSGDLAGDDGPDFANRYDNSYNVLDLSPGVGDGSVTLTTLVDGVTVRGGNALDHPSGYHSGGGLLCVSRSPDRDCTPTLRDVRFVDNVAEDGGAVYVRYLGTSLRPDDEPRFENVTFEGNRAQGEDGRGNGVGGAVFIEFMTATFVGGAFRGNVATRRGGAVYLESETAFRDVSFRGVTFHQNDGGDRGGAVNVDDSASPVFENATFTENTAVSGGAISVGGYRAGTQAASCRGCTFAANTADRGGAVAALADNGADVVITLVDTRLAGNTARLGGALFGYGSDFGDAVFTADNTVASGNRDASDGGIVRLEDDGEGTARAEFAHGSFAGHASGLASLYDATQAVFRNVAASEDGGSVVTRGGVVFDHAVLSGGCPAGATCSAVTDADPLFADADGADGVPGTLDDDLRLLPGSPALDAGSAALVPPDRLDLDADGEMDDPLPFDIAGLPRVIGGAPDLGAFERSGDAFAQVEFLGRPVVGSGGGPLAVRLRAGNTSSGPLSGELRVDFVFADGSVVSARDPTPITLAAGETFGPVETVLQVPAGAPAGPALVRARVVTDGGVVAQTTAPFEVSTLSRLVVTVTTRGDEYGTIPGGTDTGCALREAIEAVNRDEDFDDCVLIGAGAPAIVQLSAGLYRLTRDDGYTNDAIDGDIPVFRALEVRGAGQFTTTVLADYEDFNGGIFDVRTDAGSFLATGLTLTGGAQLEGGAVYAPGIDLTLDDVGLISNRAGNGGGVYHSGGALVVRDSYVSGNEAAGGAPVFDDEQARDGGRGAGIASVDATSVLVQDTVFEDNTAGRGGAVGDDDGAAGDGGNGGGLYIARAASLTVAGGRFTGNAAGDGGGASDGSTGSGGEGGGLYVREVPDVSVRGTRFEDNAAGVGGFAAKSDVDTFGGRGGFGGGMALVASTAELLEVALVDNAAGDGGGGFDEGAGSGGGGGGLYATGSALTVDRSLVAGNVAGDGGNVSDGGLSEPPGRGGDGGGLYLTDSVSGTVRTSTLSGNAAGAGGSSDVSPDGDAGRGGGARLAGVALRNVTVTQNEAGEGGGLYVTSGLPTIAVSVVAGNVVGGDAEAPTADCAGLAFDDGFNVVGAGTGCVASGDNSVAVDPGAVSTLVLDGLADNGGPTLTHALRETPANPAIDIGGSCGPEDQRGSVAPVDGDQDGQIACDAGAVEQGAFIVSAGSDAPLVFALAAPSPNPSRTAAALDFALPSAVPVRLDVFDATGRRIATLLDAVRGAGRHRVTLDVSRLAAGVYVARLAAGDDVATRVLTVVR